MMKRLFEKGKLFGLMLLALGLVFAGCVSGGSSSEESAVKSTASNSAGVPMTFTGGDNPELWIGDQVGTATGTVIDYNGHPVEIVNGDTSFVGGVPQCSPQADGAQCWIKLINRDPDNGMANVFVSVSACDNCPTATFDNADVESGAVIPGVSYNFGDPGAPGPLVNGGFCYAEDGKNYQDVLSVPNNYYGCPTHELTNQYPLAKPQQIIHPDCGQRSVMWDFANQTQQYKFYAILSADYFPWSPFANSDYDFQNRTTVYLTIAALDDRPGIDLVNTRVGWFWNGSYERSTALSGYGAPTNQAASLVEGQYFGLNIAAEFPDRLESMYVGHYTNFQDYTYYTEFDSIITFDPFVVSRVKRTKNIRTPAGTLMSQNAVSSCNFVNCTSSPSNFTYDENLQTTAPYENDAQGWVAIYNYYDSWSFAFRAPGSVYNTFNNGQVILNSYAPRVAGMKGRVHFLNPTPGAVYNWSAAGGIDTDFLVEEGPDAAADIPLRLWFFYVKPGASGRGTEFWVDNVAKYTNFRLAWTNGTLTPSGFFLGTDDWLDPCYPLDPAYLDNTHKGCAPIIPPSVILAGGDGERSNPALTFTGLSTPGYGAYQQWPAHICVQ